jgi:hypothetical protein
VGAQSPPTREAVDFFETKVRPRLSESCYRCHGPEKQNSGLRLDSREGVLAGGSGEGPAVVPGKVDESPLIAAIRHEHDTLKMPPKEKLPEEAIQDLTRWVEMGAPWPTSAEGKATEPWRNHWAFQPVRAVPSPPVAHAEPVANPIDAFILARLEPLGVGLAPAADRPTLIRRVTIDLTGLPPTREEVDAFTNDPSPDAFAKVVDRLLASPRYGERWGRHWLDLARYADTKGYVFQEERRYPYSYTYRDYVVKAFNEDKPYDRFLVEQVAADLLPEGEEPGRLAALGFLTVGRRFLNNNDDIIDDRIDVVTRGLMGLTVQCARCHDHKFDPVPSEDYYSLYGVFASSVEPPDLPLIGESEAGAAADDYLKQRQARQKEADKYAEDRMAEIAADLKARLADYLAAATAIGYQADRTKLDDAARAAKVRPESLRWLIERWDEKFGPLCDRHPSVLGPWKALQGKGTDALAEQAQGLRDSAGPAVAEAVLCGPIESPTDLARRYGELLSRAETRWLDAGPPSPGMTAQHEEVLAALRDPESPWAVAADAPMRRLFNRAEREKHQGLQRKVAELDVTHPGAPPRAMVLNDKPTPYDPHVFLRGNPGRQGKAVPRQFLKLLAGEDRKPFPKGSGRLELARAIASPENPLTSRVIVNRVWLEHFGSALVNTPSDFGTRSDPPSNPELLDYLTRYLVESGWSLKALHRLVLLSNTYQQSSDHRPELDRRDPDNRLLGRANRRRLDYEASRDAILFVAGRLDERLGGRSTPLYQAPFSTRRTLYGFIDRQQLDPVARTFDFAVPDATSPKRFSTTVPQQALFVMNAPFVAEQARAIVDRPEVARADDADARIETLHRLVLGRGATPKEIDRARCFLDDGTAPDDRLSPWAAYAQVLLLTNEFMFVD